MATPLTIAEFSDLIDPTFRKIWDGKFSNKERDLVSMLHTVQTPDLLTEKGSGITGMGLFSEFTGTISYDGPDQGYDWSSSAKQYAKGMLIERMLFEYEQFGMVEKMFDLLADSAFNSYQEEAIQTLVQGFVTDAGYTHTEGVPLFSDSHTSPRSGVSTTVGFDNLTTAALSPTALKALRIQARKFKQDNGQPIANFTLDTIIGPPDLEDRVSEIVKTVSGLDTAEGNINVLKGEFNYIPVERLTDTNNYYVVNMNALKKNCIWFEKIKPEYSRIEDFDTINAKCRGYYIIHRARADWRIGIGASVS
jgi:hypothetical protein